MSSALLVSTGVIALAEIGDKTQLLAFLLASRFKRPIPIILGILVATLINHGLAGMVGAWVTQAIGAEVLRWVLGLSFLGMAVWTLIPDKLNNDDIELVSQLGVFSTTFLAFFLAEMGDKTQLATVAMAAHYSDVFMVVAGTTLGMLIADVPAVFVGNRLANKIPMRLVHAIAAALFAALGLATLLGVGKSLGF
jgi:Ca2+/H+ antiporter, TMEM165/GDT1 family